jgi:hypothetical protein
VKFSSGCGPTGYLTRWWPHLAKSTKATIIKLRPGQDVPNVSTTMSK